ncbi:MAG TPA: hypothetical protein VLQ45_28460, partial [Thermoanaerobaculia bacterium]|nr:hypothetical protein [Thermoanaerobaculia bacterium]
MKQRIILGEFAGVELEGNPERSYLRSAEELTSLEKEYLRQGDIEKAAQAAQALAECLRRVGDLQGAEDHSKRALLFYKETHNLGGVAWTEWHTGTALRQR